MFFGLKVGSVRADTVRSMCASDHGQHTPQAGRIVLKRLLNSFSVLTLMLCTGVGALQAQNSLAINPVTIFLNGVVGGGPVQQTFAVTSSPVATVPFTATFT